VFDDVEVLEGPAVLDKKVDSSGECRE